MWGGRKGTHARARNFEKTLREGSANPQSPSPKLETTRSLLLNVDVKIASKALASRLEKVLPEIIHPDQYAYVKGRTIFDAVRTIDDIMEYTKIKQLPGLMVAFDFEKTFDSLSWPFLFKALKSFNFGESFIKWVSKQMLCDTNV